jgi:hypothetical protein
MLFTGEMSVRFDLTPFQINKLPKPEGPQLPPQLPVAGNQWHTLRVNFKDSRFTVLFNGKELFTAEDSTFKEMGKVGLWTKADSVTLFDDFSYGAE